MKDLNTIEKGKIGEAYTVKHLRKKRYKILEKNMRNSYGEIDIIASNKEYIIFVEVKSRSTENEIRPSYAVDLKKQKRIMAAAHGYIKEHSIKKQPRFDVAEVYLDNIKSKPYKINYIENAYIQGGSYAVF